MSPTERTQGNARGREGTDAQGVLRGRGSGEGRDAKHRKTLGKEETREGICAWERCEAQEDPRKEIRGRDILGEMYTGRIMRGRIMRGREMYRREMYRKKIAR